MIDFSISSCGRQRIKNNDNSINIAKTVLGILSLDSDLKIAGILIMLIIEDDFTVF